MEKFHIYEEIGKGEFSQVFKGREKKTIEYVAIKRIDKGMMPKVVNEVQIIHRLESPHILKFHDWYETRNNLWLIVEYCTGGDLESLLKQDGHLPETSVRSFSLDILSGLKFCKKIPVTNLGESPVAQRGTPPYMAPELFTSEGVHSYASDLWAVGCLMYELRRGYTPFGDSSLPLTQLIENVRKVVSPISSPPILPSPSPANKNTTPGHNNSSKNSSNQQQDQGQGGNKGGRGEVSAISMELQDLLLWLLEKSPMHRCDWSEVMSHPFWGSHRDDPPANLPVQPAYDAMINHLKLLERQSQLSEWNIDLNLLDLEDGDSNFKLDIQGLALGSPVMSPSAQLHQATLDSSRTPAADVVTAGGIQEVDLGSSQTQQGQRRRTRQSLDLGATGTVNANAMGQSLRGAGSAVVETNPLAVESLLIDDCDLQVKPIVNNRSIETMERATYRTSLFPTGLVPTTFEAASRLSLAELQSHLVLIYRALNKVVTQTTNASGNMSGNNLSAAVATAFETKHSLLAYLLSLAPASEVANFVLNSNFLQLILKLVKNPLVSSNSSKTTTLSKTNPHLTTRVLAITVLAVMLRYATSIHPTSSVSSSSAKTKDDHIIPTLVSVLKDAGRSDAKLKRRVVAALGEIMFYLSAQEDETDDDAPKSIISAKDKLTIPDSGYAALAKALRDDSDEVVRHYAAKAIENILIQGAHDIRRNLVSLDIATRLLELSLNGRNEHMQATCAMALFHTLALVLASSETTVENLQLTLTNQQRSSLAAKTLKMPPIAVSGVKFVARVLEKGALQGIVDSIRDGQPRLQQAFLNILNLVFMGPLSYRILADELDSNQRHRMDGEPQEARVRDEDCDQFMFVPGRRESSVSNNEIENCLRSQRQFLCKAPGLLTSLLRLVEQGASTSIRAKALLSLQLLGQYTPSILSAIAESRFTSCLSKILETSNQDHHLDQSSGQANDDAEAGFNYLNRSTYSWLAFLRTTLLESAKTLTKELQALKKEVELLDGHQKAASSVYSTPGKNGKDVAGGAHPSRAQSPSMTPSTSDRPQSQSDRTPQRDEEKGDSSAQAGEYTESELSSMISSSSCLRAGVALMAPPVIRRLVLVTGFVAVVAEILPLIQEVRVCMDRTLGSVGAGSKRERESEIRSVFHMVEDSMIATVETIAQFDIYSSEDGHSGGRADGLVVVERVDAWVRSWLGQFFPAVIGLSSYPDGNVRIIISSSLRRIIPHVVDGCMLDNGQLRAEYLEGLENCLRGLLSQASMLLGDDPPIPQHFLRILAELAISSDAMKAMLCNLLAQDFVKFQQNQRSSVLFQIVKMLSDSVLVDRDHGRDVSEDELVYIGLVVDPQITLLLSILLESPSCQLQLLQLNIVSILARSFEASVFLDLPDSSSLLLELWCTLLNQVERAYADATDRTPSSQKGIKTSQGFRTMSKSTMCDILMPLVPSCEQLCEFLHRLLSVDSKNTAAGGREDKLNGIVDAGSFCLSVLQSLFAEVFVEQILSSEVMMSTVCEILRPQQACLKCRYRMLTIIGGILSTVSTSKSPLNPDARSYLTSSSLRATVGACTRIASTATSPGSNADLYGKDVSVDSFTTFARHIEQKLQSLQI